MKKPENKSLVSVCLPTYNGETFLKEALESIKIQTYRPLELVCSDDHSTDRTKQILENFRDESDFPVYIIDHQPAGIGANWNNCLKNSKGKFIKFLFQDDTLEASCIEIMVQEISSNTDIGLVASKRGLMVSGSKHDPWVTNWIKEYSDLQEVFKNEGKIVLDKDFFASKLFKKHPINKIAEPSGILIKKKILKKVGYFKEDMIQILDAEFYNRVLKNYKIMILPDKLYNFRLHPEQTSNKNEGRDEEDFELYDRLLLKKYFWYLNHSVRLQLLDKYSPNLAKLYRLIHRKIKAVK